MAEGWADMRDVNRLLANTTRTDLIGHDVWLDTSILSTPEVPWRSPQPGFAGRLYLGHQTDITDPCLFAISISGESLHPEPLRHTWTPAGQETLYRLDTSHGGVLMLHEEKWISETGLCAEWQFHHNGAVPLTIDVTPRGGVTASPLSVTVTTQSLYQPLTTLLYTVCEPATSVTVPPLTTVMLSFVCGLGTSHDAAAAAFQQGKQSTLSSVQEDLNRWFDDHAPGFSCDDPDLTRLYYYRWFVVYRSLHQPDRWFPQHPMPGTLIYESPSGGWFSAPIGLPLPLQIRELRWDRHPAGVADTISAWTKNAGALRSYIGDPVHAAVLFDAHHPNVLNAQALLDAALAFLDGAGPRSPRIIGGSVSTFPVTVGSWVTGTEFAPDFFAVTPTPWDHTVNEEQLAPPELPRAGEADSPTSQQLGHLRRADTDTFHLLLIRAAAHLATRLHHARAHDLQQAAEAMVERLLQLHGDATGVFRSVDAQTGQFITDAVGFEAILPFLVTSGSPQQRAALRTLLSEQHLLAPFGLTSASQQCPAFSPNNTWEVGPYASHDQPYRYPCCWNGPAWNFATSWALLGLGHVAQVTGDAGLQDSFQTVWQRWNRAHWYQGDPSLPLVMEHYHPYTGQAFRVIPDYFHSAWLDAFFRYVIGIDEREGQLEVHPLVGIGAFRIDHLPWLGGSVTIDATPTASGYDYQITFDEMPTGMNSVTTMKGTHQWPTSTMPNTPKR